MYYSITTYRQLTTDMIQTVTIVWRHAYLASGAAINPLALPWETALDALNPTGSTPGSWKGLQHSSHDDGADTMNAASTNCDAIVSMINGNHVTFTFEIKNTSQSGLAAAIQAKYLQLHGTSIPAANVGVTNITIKVKGA